MSSFERYAAQRLVEQARAVGVDVQPELLSLSCGAPSYAARRWAELHPDEPGRGCCWGDALKGAESCTCWQPVFEVEQAEPRPPADPADITARSSMCGDCAFRKGSPEREEEWTEEALFDLARGGQPFWCHDGMRRPAYWLHPDGRRVEGSPDDWKPATVGRIPFRADGRPGMLCAGWLARAMRAGVEAEAR